MNPVSRTLESLSIRYEPRLVSGYTAGTQGKIAAINQYKPQVIVDLHEMGGDQSYYFAPAAEPFNPHMTADQIDNMNQIGRNNGKHFDDFGFDYFTREIFDAFYPGYGDSWPTFYGASVTYEVGSARGQQFTV